MTQNGDKGKGCSERERTGNGVLAFGEGREGLLRISSEGDTQHDADDPVQPSVPPVPSVPGSHARCQGSVSISTWQLGIDKDPGSGSLLLCPLSSVVAIPIYIN